MWLSLLQGIDGLPDEVTELMSLATTVPPVARMALLYVLFIVGALLFFLALFCLIRNSGRQETLSLEGTAHYAANDEKNKKAKAQNGLANGKGMESKTNAGYDEHTT